MNPLGHYLPADRYRALASGLTLPEYTEGAALFADISGFTPLTEALTRTLGQRRGAEELTGHLNRVYGALIGEVDRFRGSVIAFAGDAVTCWFEADDGRRAVAAGCAMQKVMGQLERVALPDGDSVSLAMKAAVAAGPARRVVVGQADCQLIDVFAGRTLDRMGMGGYLAGRGQVVVDQETVERLGHVLEIGSWLGDDTGAGRVAHVVGLATPMPPDPWPDPPPLDNQHIRPWLIPAVFRRLSGGEGEFLTELRPAIALFLKFAGLDFDNDPDAGRKLTSFVSWVQKSLSELDGFLIDVSTGDKGSYLYAVFGAPVAHEDDPWRALTAAHRLARAGQQFDFVTGVQIGLSRGTMRTGAYGGPTRRTYGVLGDEVNMAARLMERASRDQILVSETLEGILKSRFAYEPLDAFQPKGKRRLVRVFALLNPSSPAPAKTDVTEGLLPLVGRHAELARLEQLWTETRRHHGQAVGLIAEAGMGKSRLMAEFLKRTAADGPEVLTGRCLAHGSQTSYLGWWPIWRRFFGAEGIDDPSRLGQHLGHTLEAIDPALLLRLPLLGAALHADLPDNEVTSTFDAKLRKSSLEALLVSCVRHRALQHPLVFVLEDCHWIDPLSRDLTETLTRSTGHLPVLIVATYRPPEGVAERPVFPPELPQFSELRLENLTGADAEQFLQLKAVQLFGPSFRFTPAVIKSLIERAQGNPYYLEELLHYLFDQGLGPESGRAIGVPELPSTLHSLILSRIDRLEESQKTTLKVASVIGRIFGAELLAAVHPRPDVERVRGELREFERLELTRLDRPEPDLSYLFRQVVIQEVAYESMSFATRASLHQQVGLFLERRHAHELDQQADLLAHHFDRSPDQDRRRIYLLRAGELAQARYANSAAIDYYQRVLALLPPEDRISAQLKYGGVLELVGRWDEAGKVYAEALAQAQIRVDRHACARCQAAMGDLERKRGAYAEAKHRLADARQGFQDLGDEAGLAETLQTAGTIAAQLGDYDEAADLYSSSLQRWSHLGNDPRTASLLSNSAIVCLYRGQLEQARALHEQALDLRRKIGDRRAIANSLNNLGLVLREQGAYADSRRMIEESLMRYRELGDRWNVANSLASLAEVSLDQEDYRATHRFLTESLEIDRELGDRYALAFVLEIAAMLAAALGQPRGAVQLAATASRLRIALGAALSPTEQTHLDQALAKAVGQLSETERRSAFDDCGDLPPDQIMERVLLELQPPDQAT